MHAQAAFEIVARPAIAVPPATLAICVQADRSCRTFGHHGQIGVADTPRFVPGKAIHQSERAVIVVEREDDAVSHALFENEMLQPNALSVSVGSLRLNCERRLVPSTRLRPLRTIELTGPRHARAFGSPPRAKGDSMVSPVFVDWNQLERWLRAMDSLRFEI